MQLCLLMTSSRTNSPSSTRSSSSNSICTPSCSPNRPWMFTITVEVFSSVISMLAEEQSLPRRQWPCSDNYSQVKIEHHLRKEALFPLFKIYWQVKLFPFKQEFILMKSQLDVDIKRHNRILVCHSRAKVFPLKRECQFFYVFIKDIET